MMSRDVGKIIGKGGEKIKNIRSESGANVNVQSQVPNTVHRVAQVRGGIEGVTKAIKMIADLLSTEKPMVTLLVESKNLGPVIGKGGETISRIRQDTQATINIASECIGNSSQKEVRISGDATAFAQAIESVVMHLSEGTTPVRFPYIPHAAGMLSQDQYQMMPSLFTNIGRRGQDKVEPPCHGFKIETTITIPKNIVGKIIGRGGARINSVRRNSGATIVLNSEADEDTRKITISGSAHSINMACMMIEALAGR